MSVQGAGDGTSALLNQLGLIMGKKDDYNQMSEQASEARRDMQRMSMPEALQGLMGALKEILGPIMQMFGSG